MNGMCSLPAPPTKRPCVDRACSHDPVPRGTLENKVKEGHQIVVTSSDGEFGLENQGRVRRFFGHYARAFYSLDLNTDVVSLSNQVTPKGRFVLLTTWEPSKVTSGAVPVLAPERVADIFAFARGRYRLVEKGARFFRGLDVAVHNAHWPYYDVGSSVLNDVPEFRLYVCGPATETGAQVSAPEGIPARLTYENSRRGVREEVDFQKRRQVGFEVDASEVAIGRIAIEPGGPVGQVRLQGRIQVGKARWFSASRTRAGPVERPADARPRLAGFARRSYASFQRGYPVLRVLLCHGAKNKIRARRVKAAAGVPTADPGRLAALRCLVVVERVLRGDGQRGGT